MFVLVVYSVVINSYDPFLDFLFLMVISGLLILCEVFLAISQKLETQLVSLTKTSLIL